MAGIDSGEARFKKSFGLFDINKNGKIEPREIQAIATYLGYRIKEDFVYRIIKRFDSTERGEISYEDFVSALQGPAEEKTEAQLREEMFHVKFDQYIKEPGGHVTYDVACNVLEAELGCHPSYKSTLMSKFGFSEGSNLSYEDFVIFYSQVLDKKEEIERSFKEFDSDNKGFISFEDAQRVLWDYGFSDDDLTALFNIHDRNRDNKLHYDEFLTFWGVL